MYLIGAIASSTFLVYSYFMAPKQTDPQFKLRMTPEIKDAIEAAAKANNRSMNAEILSRLEDSFRVDPSGRGILAVAKTFLTLNEAAKYLSMNTTSFQKLVDDGVFPKPVKIIDQTLWPLEELDEVIDSIKNNQIKNKPNNYKANS